MTTTDPKVGERQSPAPAPAQDQATDPLLTDPPLTDPSRTGLPRTGLPPTGPPADHMAARLGLVRARVEAAVADRRVGDPAPDDPFRGLYLTPETVEWIAGRSDDPPAQEAAARDLRESVEAAADQVEQAGGVVTLRRLARRFDLDDLDLELLLVALLPEVDTRFEQLFGYLNDDVTRKRPSVATALRLCSLPTAAGRARARLGVASPLVAGGLVVVEDPERPFLGRALRIPDRVVNHLLGDDTADPVLADLFTAVPPAVPLPETDRLARAVERGVRLVCVRDSVGGPGRALAAGALAAAGRRTLTVDLPRLLAGSDPLPLVARLIREARLVGGGIVAELPAAPEGPAQAASEGAAPAALRRLADSPVPVLLVTGFAWDPHWSATPPLVVQAPLFLPTDRASLWRSSLVSDEEVLRASEPFILSPDAVVRAAASARQQAEFASQAVSADDLRTGARLQNAAGLERLARRISPAVGWDDLVLPSSVLNQLQEIALRARHREQVLGQWRMRPGGGRGRGVVALFAGDSGTGKTMSAEVIAGALGLDLYTIDLATVVDKYIGETEKNLERIFTEAAGVNGVLLFDEADAVFGKRSEVKDAQDRYANVESAYLLQRMESFDGLAILATNLRANLDDAFTRRLDLIVDFPNPDEVQRRALWDHCLGDTLPRDDDLDLDACARLMDVTGGSIRAMAVTAAYLAADSDQRITMAHLMDAAQREYRKLGRLVLPGQFD